MPRKRTKKNVYPSCGKTFRGPVSRLKFGSDDLEIGGD